MPNPAQILAFVAAALACGGGLCLALRARGVGRLAALLGLTLAGVGVALAVLPMRHGETALPALLAGSLAGTAAAAWVERDRLR